MLDELRAVPWPLALALFAGGAALTAILLLLVIGSGSSASGKRRPSSVRIRSGAGAAPVAGRRASRPEAEAPPGRPASPSPSIAQMVGQRFMVGLEGVSPTTALLSDARRGRIGGLVLFPHGASPAEAAAAVRRLQRAARAGDNPPLLIATDQEGAVKRFEPAPPKPLSTLSPEAAMVEGQRTGIFLGRYGINVDLAPVVDLGLAGSFMTDQGRTISASPIGVIRVAVPFASGLESNAMPVAKHFPGLGGASANTDEEKSVVESSLRDSLKPYEALIQSGVPAIMLSTAIYTRLDPEHGAAWSPKVVEGLLRHRLGFRGLTISDDLGSPGVMDSLPSVGDAVTDSAEAGVDVVMVASPELFRPAYEQLLRAAEEGRVSRVNLASSYERILAAKKRYAP